MLRLVQADKFSFTDYDKLMQTFPLELHAVRPAEEDFPSLEMQMNANDFRAISSELNGNQILGFLGLLMKVLVAQFEWLRPDSTVTTGWRYKFLRCNSIYISKLVERKWMNKLHGQRRKKGWKVFFSERRN